MIHQFTLDAILNSPHTAVYQAFVVPQKVSNWCAPNNLKVFKFEGTMKEGEEFRLIMQGIDGFQQTITGTLHEIQRNRQIIFACQWEDSNEITKVSINIRPLKNDATQLTIKQNGFRSQNEMLLQQFAWMDCLEKLSLYLTSIEDGHEICVSYPSSPLSFINSLPT